MADNKKPYVQRLGSPLRVSVAKLLSVACPTCGAAAGAYCEREPGRVALFNDHHESRFRRALGMSGREGLS